MRILFTSVGRRVELIQAFRDAAVNMKIDLKIYGADISDSAPALMFCDHVELVPRIEDESYIPTLREICRSNEIDLIVPTIDTDLLKLAENKETFGSTRVLISKAAKIKICRDKRKTYAYFKSIGLSSPKPVDNWENYSFDFPAFIKPKDGSSSVLAYKVNNIMELKAYAEQIPDYIIQPFIKGTEYTVDVLCDFHGNPIFITPRIRLAVRSGEVLKTKISQDSRIIHEVKQLLEDYKPCGPVTIQLIREEVSGIDYYIEINPRFGGGAPLTIKSGADSAKAIMRLILGETVEYMTEAAEDGAVYSRFDQSIRVDTVINSGV